MSAGDAPLLAVSAADGSVELAALRATLEAEPRTVTFAGEEPVTVTLGEETVELAGDEAADGGADISIELLGAAAVVRAIGVVGADGSGLALLSALEPGGTGHGAERLAACLLRPGEAPTEVQEPLLSTHYDDGGSHFRADVELWLSGEEETPLRGAGSRMAGASFNAGGGTLAVASMRWSLEGRPANGVYVIWRAN